MGVIVERAGDSPPANSSRLLSRESRPEIGGSFGGFIAVVAVLAAIFVLACIGIYILLRDHEPTPYERSRRARTRNRDFSTEVPVGPPGIRARFTQLFGRRNGWIKASGGDGDEWDASEEPIHHSTSKQREQDRYPASATVPSAAAGRPWKGVAPNISMESFEVELRAPIPAPISAAFQSDTQDEDDRTDATPIALRDEPLPTSSSGPGAIAPENDYKPRDDRTFSVQLTSKETGSINVRPMQKFDNGTKFKEGLSF